MKTAVFYLSWVCLAVGILGLWLGVMGDPRSFTLPGAVLVGSAIIALAIQRE